MAVHVALMAVAAPIAALGVFLVRKTPAASRSWLWPATLAQLVLLWALHAPLLHQVVMASAFLHALALAALFLVATGFWLCLLCRPNSPPWQEILALILTAKLACLLAVLLIFAPREIYAEAHHGTAGIADQQTAGLLMLAACPISYLVPAIMLVARLFPAEKSGPRGAALPTRGSS
jgi:putative membrane protein